MKDTRDNRQKVMGAYYSAYRNYKNGKISPDDWEYANTALRTAYREAEVKDRVRLAALRNLDNQTNLPSNEDV